MADLLTKLHAAIANLPADKRGHAEAAASAVRSRLRSQAFLLEDRGNIFGIVEGLHAWKARSALTNTLQCDVRSHPVP